MAVDDAGAGYAGLRHILELGISHGQGLPVGASPGRPRAGTLARDDLAARRILIWAVRGRPAAGGWYDGRQVA